MGVEVLAAAAPPSQVQGLPPGPKRTSQVAWLCSQGLASARTALLAGHTPSAPESTQPHALMWEALWPLHHCFQEASLIAPASTRTPPRSPLAGHSASRAASVSALRTGPAQGCLGEDGNMAIFPVARGHQVLRLLGV